MTTSTTLRTAAGIALAAAFALSAPRPALAQYDNINPGLLSPRSIDRKQHERQDPGPPPDPTFTHGVRIIPGGYGGYGTTVIIVNGYPCYVPSYYDSGFYSPSFSFGIQNGTFGLGYSGRPFAPNYPPAFPPVYQRTFVPGTIGQNNGTIRQNNGAIRRDPPADSGTSMGADEDYYLNRKPKPTQRDPELAQAVADIEQAFRTGNVALLERHVDRQDTLALQSKGKSRKDLSAAVYLQMTKDALAEMNTVRFNLDHVEPASNGAWLAYGTHVLQADGGAQKRYNVGFVLRKRADRYYVTEVSADPAQ